MTSLFRPFLSSLLCCVIAFGQMPALLHMVSCHGHAHTLGVAQKHQSTLVCSHGCNDACHGVGKSVQCLGDSQHSDSQHSDSRHRHAPVPKHDSDHCAVCQSLANPVGVVWNFELPLVQECLYELASISADRLWAKASFSIPQPRGPPVA